jgi:hypothetical protein
MLPQDFEDLLKRLSPDELAFLDRCLGRDASLDAEPYLGDQSYLFYLATGEHAQFGTGVDTYMLGDNTINHAVELGLIRTEIPRKPDPATHAYYLTPLGLEFTRSLRKERGAAPSFP